MQMMCCQLSKNYLMGKGKLETCSLCATSVNAANDWTLDNVFMRVLSGQPIE